MVIESHYWREDLKRYAKLFEPVKKPPRFSERLIVNFEKDVTVSLFMVRHLAEAGRFSSAMEKHSVQLYRCRFVGKPHHIIYQDISELYSLDVEEDVSKGVPFVCNQFIHARYTFATRDHERNWDSIYVSSDYDKKKYIYRVPVAEIIRVLKLATVDYPSRSTLRYDTAKEEWIRETD